MEVLHTVSCVLLIASITIAIGIIVGNFADDAIYALKRSKLVKGKKNVKRTQKIRSKQNRR